MSSRNSLVAAAVLVTVAGCLSVNVTINTRPRPKAEIPHSKEDARPGTKVRVSWTDDFESYAAGPGTWPETWVPDANARDHSVSHVDGTSFAEDHGNTLRLHGDMGGNWSALAYRPLGAAFPLRISMDVYNGDHLGTGHHPHYCTIGLRESPPGWQQAGVILFQRLQDNSIQILAPIDKGGTVTGNGHRTTELSMRIGRWYHLEFELRQAGDKQEAIITVDDGESVQGPMTFTMPGRPFESFDQLELTAQENDVWFDNVTVEPLSE